MIPVELLPLPSKPGPRHLVDVSAPEVGATIPDVESEAMCGTKGFADSAPEALRDFFNRCVPRDWLPVVDEQRLTQQVHGEHPQDGTQKPPKSNGPGRGDPRPFGEDALSLEDYAGRPPESKEKPRMSEETTRKPRKPAHRDLEALVIGRCLKLLTELPEGNRVPVARYLLQRAEADAASAAVSSVIQQGVAPPRQRAMFD